jgi:hypothetical protein
MPGTAALAGAHAALESKTAVEDPAPALAPGVHDPLGTASNLREWNSPK